MKSTRVAGPMDKFVNAGPWRVAVELVRAGRTLRIFHTLPDGGRYDCVTVTAANVKIHINLEGASIHVL